MYICICICISLSLSPSLAGGIHLHIYFLSSDSSSETGAAVQLICCTQLRAPAVLCNATASAEKISRCASGAGFTNLLCKKHSNSTRLLVLASCRQASHSYFFIFSQMVLAQRPASRPRTTFSIGSQTLPKSTPSGKRSLNVSQRQGGASALKPARAIFPMQSPRWTGARYA